MKKRLLLVLFMFITVIGLTGCVIDLDKNKIKNANDINYNEAYDDINSNINVANDKYLNKYFIFQSKVDSIDEKGARMAGNGRIQLTVTFKNKKELKKFSTGDAIRFVGKITEIIKVDNKPRTLVISNAIYLDDIITIDGKIYSAFNGKEVKITDTNSSIEYDITDAIGRTEYFDPSIVVIDGKTYSIKSGDESVIKIKAKVENGKINKIEELEEGTKAGELVDLTGKTIPTMYIFHGDGCPHCQELTEYMYNSFEYNKLIKVEFMEVWYNSSNAELMKRTGNRLNVEVKGVPFIVIGNKYISGFGSGTSDEIKELLDKAYLDIENHQYTDVIKNLK